MEHPRTGTRFYYLLLLSLCVAACMALLAVDYLSSGAFAQVWRGYYTVLVSADHPASEVQRRFSKADLPAITSESSLVRFDDFSSQATVAVGRLHARLDSLDPRFDPYMKAIASYFHAGLWNLYYVRLDSPAPVALTRIASALHGMRWKQGDVSWRAVVLCAALFALVTLFVGFRRPRSTMVRLALLAGLLPWLPAIANGSYTGSLAGALVFLGWSSIVDLAHPMLLYFLDYGVWERERLRPIAAILLSSVFAVIVSIGVQPALLRTLVRGSVVLTLVAAALALYELSRRGQRQHRLYFPLRISSGYRSLRKLFPRALRSAWIALFLLLSPFVVFLNWSGGVEIPTPVVYSGAAHNSWTVLGRMWHARGNRRLPDLADYVAHRAYQAGLSYRANYAFPSPNEHLFERRFRHEGVRIVSRRVVVKTYNRAWFRGVLADAEGIPRMIEDQPGVILPEEKPLYYVGYPAAYILVFWLAMAAVIVSSTFLRRGMSYQLVDRVGSSVSIRPPAVATRVVRPPSRPKRRRRRSYPLERQRDLVSDGVKDGER